MYILLFDYIMLIRINCIPITSILTLYYIFSCRANKQAQLRFIPLQSRVNAESFLEKSLNIELQ